MRVNSTIIKEFQKKNNSVMKNILVEYFSKQKKLKYFIFYQEISSF
jgi:hypothetical protein